MTVGGARHLVIPYSFETNDNRFDQNLGFSTGDDFARYMIDCFETLYAEGAEQPEADVASALHDRLIGRPGRITGLVKFLDHIAATATGCGLHRAATSPSTGGGSSGLKWRFRPRCRTDSRSPRRSGAKCRTLRVATISPCSSAVAAIIRSARHDRYAR